MDIKDVAKLNNIDFDGYIDVLIFDLKITRRDVYKYSNLYGFYCDLSHLENLVAAHNSWKSKQSAIYALAEIN